MLKPCSNAILLTRDDALIAQYEELAEKCGVILRIRKEWISAHRISEEAIICTSDFADILPACYKERAFMILDKDEKILRYTECGYERLCFTRDDKSLMFAFLVDDKWIKSEEAEYDGTFFEGDYRFDFRRNNYKYGEDYLYLTKAERAYLAEWLLKGRRESKKRYLLSNMRKRFGKTFLKGIKGIKGGKECQEEQVK